MGLNWMVVVVGVGCGERVRRRDRGYAYGNRCLAANTSNRKIMMHFYSSVPISIYISLQLQRYFNLV